MYNKWRLAHTECSPYAWALANTEEEEHHTISKVESLKDLNVILYIQNKTKDWALVQTAALVINKGVKVRLV